MLVRCSGRSRWSTRSADLRCVEPLGLAGFSPYALRQDSGKPPPFPGGEARAILEGEVGDISARKRSAVRGKGREAMNAKRAGEQAWAKMTKTVRLSLLLSVAQR